MSDLREALRESARLLQRYMTETPLGHQPHMIAHEAEASIRASLAALSAEPAQEITDERLDQIAQNEARDATIALIFSEPGHMTPPQFRTAVRALMRAGIAADRASRLPEITDEQIAALGSEFGHATACEGYEHGTLWFGDNLIPFARAVEALVRGKT